MADITNTASSTPASPSLPSFIVLMGASRSNKLMTKYLAQLEKGNISYNVDYLNITTPSIGLGYCLETFRQLARRFSSYDRLIITDAWDVLCYGTREEISSSLSTLSPSVLFASERNLYPEAHLAAQIASSHAIPPRYPWRYVNGGALTASPQSLLSWCDEVERHPAYDPGMIGQQWLNRRRAEGNALVRIDWATHLFYCMFLEHESPELTRHETGLPYNKLTGTSPRFIHFNGGTDWTPFLTMMRESEIPKL